jgi:hypothetical protein
LDLQIFKCSSCPGPILKLLKSDGLEWEIEWSDFSILIKFGHQHMPSCFLVKLVY